MAGWVRARGGAWVVEVGDICFDLLVARDALDFLHECLSARHYVCWASGLVIATRRTKLMMPDDVSVYFVGAPPAPVPSPALGLLLAENGHKWELAQAWLDAVWGRDTWARGRRVAHPLSLSVPPAQPLPIDSREVSLGYVFAAHMDREISTGTGQFLGSDSTNLGTCGVKYSHRAKLCVHADDEERRQFCTTRCIPRGCIIVVHLAQSLLLVANGCCRFPASAVASQCLVVVPREALSSAQEAMRELNPYVACTERMLQERPHSENLVLVSAELAGREMQLLSEQMWTRVIICDWIRVADTVLKRRAPDFAGKPSTSVMLFPCHLQIVLLTTDGILEAGPRLANFGEVSLLLGTPLLMLGSPSANRALLQTRVLRVEDQPESGEVWRYDVVELPPLLRDVQEDLAGCRSFRTTMALLLGGAATAGRSSLSSLPPATTLRQYFSLQRGAASTFAQASFDESAEHGCAVCLSDAGASAVTRCGHWFCPCCLAQALANCKQCPVCRQALVDVRDAVVCRGAALCSSFLVNLSHMLKQGDGLSHRQLLVCSFGSCMERVALLLRSSGINALAWSGNSRQLLRNLERFRAAPCVLLCDPQFLSLQWIDLADVRSILCVLPICTEERELCCQLRPILQRAPSAQLSFVSVNHASALPPETHSCECSPGCPLLVRRK